MSESNTLIELAIKKEALLFGDFKLKSGRQSPYFFNAGKLNDGQSIATLASLYARTLIDSGIQCDTLFGPAYKGIPLVAATAAALYRDHQQNIPWCFNRKEAKTHGEGGDMVGAALKGNVVVVDDVITAGTAIRESFSIIEQAGAKLAGVIVSLDRQERGHDQRSAVQEIQSTYAVPVLAVASFSSLIDYIEQSTAYASQLASMQAYRDRYGV